MLMYPLRHVLRLTLEAITPLSASSGDLSADFDTCLFRDWNGLPCLSGATLAGVLRAIHADYYGKAASEDLFGMEDKAGNGRSSGLMVSFGMVHDEKGTPVTGYLGPEAIATDTVLAALAEEAPLLRDHVALTPTGAAADKLKFDRVSCPVGTRFTLDLALDGETGDGERLRTLARLFAVPYLRLGGAGRRGLGRQRVVSAYQAAIDRRAAAGRDRWVAYRRAGLAAMPAACGFMQLPQDALEAPPAASSQRVPIEAILRVTPKWFWRIGQGEEPWAPLPKDANAPDVSPRVETVLRWDGSDRLVRKPLAPVPGSAVKGAIAHRTEFHLRRLQDGWAEREQWEQAARKSAVLFGAARDAGSGTAGAVLVDDVIVDFGKQTTKTALRTRNSIDRHTGGVRLQKLFTDETLWQGPSFEIPITLLARHPDGSWVDEQAVQALDWAIEDLGEGRLALGGREAAGDGVFEQGSLTVTMAGDERRWGSFTETLRAARECASGAVEAT
jgi:CRISPR/Cas system CMR subunit Cmr4 (Cas7 group RAMP superfamily)